MHLASDLLRISDDRYRALQQQAGSTLVEVLVALALMGIMLPAFAQANLIARGARPTANQRLQAGTLLGESLEAVRVVREKGWNNVATNGTYYPAVSGSSWTLNAGSQTIGNLTRQIVINDVQRNTSGSIVSSGGTVDPSTKKITATVNWTQPIPGTLSDDTYLSRWQANATWTQTTQADFIAGLATNTTVLASGDVQLADTPATWQLPSTIGGLTITGSVSGLCVYKAVVATVPYAFVGYSGGLAIINVSNPASPTLTGTFATTAAVNGVYVSGNFAYLATAITNAEFKIINISNPALPTQASSLQVGGTTIANGVTVSGTTAYLVKNAAAAGNSEFYVINVSNPAAPAIQGNIGRQRANFTSVAVSGTFAYVSTALANNQLSVINVSNPAAPAVLTGVNLGVTANDITVIGTTAYIATNNNVASGELRIYNITTPSAPTSLGSYEVGGNVLGVSIDASNPNYAVLATAVATKQAIAVNISAPATPTSVSTINYGSTINKMFVSGTYAYAATTNTAQGAAIFYAGFHPAGTLESSTFDAGGNAGFNALAFTISVPGGSSLQFQVAANNTGSGWSYVGPDGAAGTFFTAGAPLPLSLASNRYFRYKAYFTPTTNGQQSPQLSDVTLNYSP